MSIKAFIFWLLFEFFFIGGLAYAKGFVDGKNYCRKACKKLNT